MVSTQDDWNTSYTHGHRCRQPSDHERSLLATHILAPAEGRDLDVGRGVGCVGRDLAPVGRVALRSSGVPSACRVAATHRAPFPPLECGRDHTDWTVGYPVTGTLRSHTDSTRYRRGPPVASLGARPLMRLQASRPSRIDEGKKRGVSWRRARPSRSRKTTTDQGVAGRTKMATAQLNVTVAPDFAAEGELVAAFGALAACQHQCPDCQFTAFRTRSRATE